MHDTVAQKNFDPVLPPLPDDFEDELEEESVKIVRLVKNKEPLVSQEEEEDWIPEVCRYSPPSPSARAPGRHHQAGRLHRHGDRGSDHERRSS